MKNIILAFGLCTLVLGLLDFLWLSIMTKRFYAPLMGELLRTQIAIMPAIGFYLLYAFGIAYILVLPALNGFDALSLGFKSALFGLVAYGTYNLTALAIINGFDKRLAIIDMSWGALVTATTTIIVCLIIKKFNLGA